MMAALSVAIPVSAWAGAIPNPAACARVVGAGADLSKTIESAAAVSSGVPLSLSWGQYGSHLAARAGVLTSRTVTLPGHFWPFNQAARLLAHGEPLTGLTPASAVKVAIENSERGVATVVGRLSDFMPDVWSVRGVERSYTSLIEQLGAARRAKPSMETAIAFDPSYFGYNVVGGVSEAERERVSIEAMVRLARNAKANGVGVQMDMTDLESAPFIARAAEAIVRQAQIPVRLAISARYEQSEQMLAQWANVGRETGIKVGVRLVKGSFVQPMVEGVINERQPLLEQYKRMITKAMENDDALDIAVATQNEEIFRHAEAEAARLGADYKVNVIRGVNPPVQDIMRAAGRISAEYVSYGIDGPKFGLTELYNNWRARRAIAKTGVPIETLD